MSSVPKFQGNTRFEVRGPLGEGGMGSVYEVIDHDRGARVALKVLSRMSPTSVDQFKNEFRGLSGVVHPNLVRLHELVSDGELWAFTMDLVEGVPFIDYVRRGDGEGSSEITLDDPRREPAAATMKVFGAVGAQSQLSGRFDEARLNSSLRQLALGIHAIHAVGKVHRDIKHSNVLVGSDGRVVILDFGLVADAALRSDAEAPGGVWGTPAYMAPEQAAGKVATAASDWYAFGVMLYEALTGRLPFAGKAQEVLLAKQRAHPVPPSAWVKDVPPGLEALCLQLMSFRGEDRPTGSEVLGWLGVARPTSERARDMPRRPVFVGRARELAALGNALQRSEHAAQVVLVEGLSGMGKTAIAEEVIDRLRRDDPRLVVLSGRCYARESVPFKAFDGLIDSLTQWLNTLPESEVAVLIPPGAPALIRMFPALLGVGVLKRLVDGEALPADPMERRRLGVACLRALLDRVSRAVSLLVYIDDLQWGDEDSAQLWIELLSDPASPRLSWLGTFRSDERSISPCLQLLLGVDGISERVGLRVQLHSLSSHEVAELAAGVLPPEMMGDAKHALTDESGGNPYFALELARELRSRPPSRPAESRPLTLDQALSQRVSRLPDPAQQLLRVVSVAARPIDQKVAFRVAGLGYAGLSSLTELQGAHLIRVLGAHNHLMTAYHDRIREVVLDGLPASDLRQLHRDIAETFEQRGDADPELMTEHLVGAGELTRAARYAVRAAEQASRALAFGRAASLYRMALDHTTDSAEEREALRVRLAEALVNAGRGADAARVYLDAADESPTRKAELRRLGAEQLIVSGHIDEGLAVLGDVLRQCGLELPPPGETLARTMELAARLRERGLEFSPRDPSLIAPEIMLRLDVCWAVALGFTGSEPERLMPIVLQHLLDALDAGSPYHVLRALCLFIGNGATATRPGSRTIATALASAEALQTMVTAVDAEGWIATAKGMINFLSRGDATAALPCFELAEHSFRTKCRGVSRAIGMAQVGILASHAELGRIAEYRVRYPAYLKDAEERSDLYLTMYHRSYHAALYYLAVDDADRAWAEVDLAVTAWGRDRFDQCALFSLLSRLEVLLYRGGPAAHEWALQHGPAFLGSILATGHYFRARFFSLRGRAAVAAALSGSDAGTLLEQAEQDLREIEQSELKVAPGLALALRASIHSARGQGDELAAALERLGTTLQDGDTMLSACARLHHARLSSGPDAAPRRAAILAELRAESVQNPAQWAQMYLPLRRSES